MTIDNKINTSRRLLMLGGLNLASSVAYPLLLSAADTGISTRQRVFLNGNHAFITVARKGRYMANMVTAEEITGRRDDFATTQFVRKAKDAYVCFNGSLFRNKDAASGLEIHNGQEKMPYVENVGDGVLFTDGNGQVHIMPIKDFLRSFSKGGGRYYVVDALQLNLLRYNDKIKYKPNELDKRVQRNLIGLTKDGDMIDVIFKNTNFTLGDMYMRTQHGCITVGALDGDTSASAFDINGRSSYIQGRDKPEEKVPNFVVLYQR